MSNYLLTQFNGSLLFTLETLPSEILIATKLGHRMRISPTSAGWQLSKKRRADDRFTPVGEWQNPASPFIEVSNDIDGPNGFRVNGQYFLPFRLHSAPDYPRFLELELLDRGGYEVTGPGNLPFAVYTPNGACYRVYIQDTEDGESRVKMDKSEPGSWTWTSIENTTVDKLFDVIDDLAATADIATTNSIEGVMDECKVDKSSRPPTWNGHKEFQIAPEGVGATQYTSFSPGSPWPKSVEYPARTRCITSHYQGQYESRRSKLTPEHASGLGGITNRIKQLW